MSEPPSPRLRILEIEIVGRGGLAHYVHNLSRALAERGHQVTLLTAANYELVSRGRPEGFRIVRRIARGSGRFGPSLPGLALAIWRKVEAIFDALAAAALVRRLRPDIVHLHCTNPIALLYLGLLRSKERLLVATAHVVTPHEPIPLGRPIYRRIHRLCRRIIAHSEFDRQRLTREFEIDPERVLVIPHGDYGFFGNGSAAPDRESGRRRLGLSPSDEVALFFGYIREYKGLDVLLESWPAVVDARPAARLVIAGDPVRLGRDRRDELESWAARLGAVRHFGYVPFSEVGLHFAAADVLVMPYRHISQSGVLYLALALGLPVVATRVGALPEMLEDGQSAVLVPPESPAALSQALVRVLGDAGLRRRLARGGRRIARRHSWPAIAERTERAFASAAPGQRLSS